MSVKNNLLVTILEFITNACTIIATYAATIYVIIYIPYLSDKNHNIHASLVMNITMPIAAILALACMIQILVTYKYQIDNIEYRPSKFGFIAIGGLISLALGIVAIMMPSLYIYQIFSGNGNQ